MPWELNQWQKGITNMPIWNATKSFDINFDSIKNWFWIVRLTSAHMANDDFDKSHFVDFRPVVVSISENPCGISNGFPFPFGLPQRQTAFPMDFYFFAALIVVGSTSFDFDVCVAAYHLPLSHAPQAKRNSRKNQMAKLKNLNIYLMSCADGVTPSFAVCRYDWRTHAQSVTATLSTKPSEYVECIANVFYANWFLG